MIVDQGGYWGPLAALLRSSWKAVSPNASHLDHLAFVSDLERLLPAIAAMPRDIGREARTASDAVERSCRDRSWTLDAW